MHELQEYNKTHKEVEEKTEKKQKTCMRLNLFKNLLLSKVDILNNYKESLKKVDSN